ncbi:hypothetical protein ACODM8_05190 [Vibrio ostreicida]|uniref:Uncharacterized protein n=1 Tax=Vibrio ostreicida TaxID=526588 RepID=A0ABT8BZX8_9VIBR|nr:hypothetical protein [Vibrio ostreicida]MDN3611600.1 hypothetical protein [Vibrio ostreicida]NPD09091.1 hypothetical protein [Vibrio ostreicida]
MLLDVLIQSVHEFQADCMKLCEKHYPTIHNKGMSEHHLSLAFSRRLSRTLIEFGHHCEHVALDCMPNAEHPHHYRISSEIGTVWVLSSDLVSAGSNCRQKLFRAVTHWQQEYAYAIQPNDLLLLISDHWMSRNLQSRELLHWWAGHLPDELGQYKSQGIDLRESDEQLAETLEQQFGLCPYFVKFTHPLRRSTDKKLVRKYVQLYSVIQLS